ncbi:MAG: MAPEG family protein [Marinicaulis sp.]|nr:MAPEG family protein [Marinicaulis sp.]NNE40192.1 MAPEG family protein [Marinicaulis sp.]NNL87974.1 MAPEG family protein [Marinicaulis sp.]
MAVSLLCVGLLGLLVFLLGANVSRVRQSVAVTQHEDEANPESSLRKAIRAHGNCIEYVPMLSLMILAIGLAIPMLVSKWIVGLMFAAVASRYIHAIGILTGGSVYAGNPLKTIGAVGTYVTGAALSVILIVRAAGLF